MLSVLFGLSTMALAVYGFCHLQMSGCAWLQGWLAASFFCGGAIAALAGLAALRK